MEQKASSRILQQREAIFAPLPNLFTAPLELFSKLLLSAIAKNWMMWKKGRKKCCVRCWKLGGAESLQASNRMGVGQS